MTPNPDRAMKKKAKKVFRSMDEYQKYYFPKTYEDEIWKKYDGKELGERLAKESLERIAKALRPLLKKRGGK